MIANQAEGTLQLLRYSLGGNRPSQTDPLPLSPGPLQGSGLESSRRKGGVSSSARRKPKSALQSLPLTLSIPNKNPVTAYSKGARGLSVLLRVGGIFTATTISPGLSPRQSSTRYTIRAGRNLPDKEFRYLRTVIVTADIHGGLDAKLAPHAFTFPHWSRVTPYISSFELAECCVFDKQSVDPVHCGPLRGTPSTEDTGLICRVP